MDRAVARAVRLGCSPAEAVAAATSTPAGLIGLEDVGRIEPGYRADLVALDEELAVTGVWRGGVRVAGG
jgi:N-acetylglucosamine-6-phosphate deacetylase